MMLPGVCSAGTCWCLQGSPLGGPLARPGMPYSSSGCGLLEAECRRDCGVSASRTLMLGLPCSQSGASAARRPAEGVTSHSTDCRSSPQISGVCHCSQSMH